jgi:hypothetical protein
MILCNNIKQVISWPVTVLYERALASLGFTCKEHWL